MLMTRHVATSFLLSTCLVVGAVLPTSAQTGNTEPEHLIVALDFSGSNPVMKERGFASRAGQFVSQRIETLSMRSKLSVRSFGIYDVSSNDAVRIDEVMSLRNKGLGQSVGKLIASIPDAVANGRIQEQQGTSIIGYLETLARTVSCKDQPTTILLITDGIENSEQTKAEDLLAGKKDALEVPRTGLLAGCSVTMFGVGQGQNSPRITRTLDTAWSAWFAKAGAVHRGINDQ